jgi:hypothetical protein
MCKEVIPVSCLGETVQRSIDEARMDKARKVVLAVRCSTGLEDLVQIAYDALGEDN